MLAADILKVYVDPIGTQFFQLPTDPANLLIVKGSIDTGLIQKPLDLFRRTSTSNNVTAL